jgi:putative hydrolase of HD superfamily
MAFGRIDRTACRHRDGTPESDSDHTVMLAWLAPSLAAAIAPQLDAGLVAQFAVVHDAVETFAGDTPTLRIGAGELAAKKAREKQAELRWHDELDSTLPWLPAMISRYEAQREPEARFTRAVDKICPKLVHLLNGTADLAGYGITAGELDGILTRQRAGIASYAGEFTLLLDLYDDLARRAMSALRDYEATTAGLAHQFSGGAVL